MKKVSKRKRAAAFETKVTPQVEEQPGLDTAGMIAKIQQQLVSLEAKIDSLIQRSTQRPSGENNFNRSFQPKYDNSQRFGNNNFRERGGHRAICAECGAQCEVPFKPTGDRPVYCKECFSRRKESGVFKPRFDRDPRGNMPDKHRSFDKPRHREDSRQMQDKKAGPRRGKKRRG